MPNVKTVVAAIDIGITNSCCVYSLKHDRARIAVIKFSDNDHVIHEKVPTVVLFNKKREFHSFGFEAENYFGSLRNDEEKKRWYFFKGFHRIANDCMTPGSELSERSGKKIETYKVYGSVIKVFTDRIHTLLLEQHTGLHLNDLHVVFTVPPVLTKSYKNMLQKAFLYAGFKDGYSFVRETEAVLSYWEHTLREERRDLRDEKGFLLVNLRGRTATVTALTVRNGVIRRLLSVSGGGWGGQAVNEEFKQFLIKVVGAPVFQKFIEEEESQWIDLERQFELKKQTAKSEGGNVVTLPLSVDLREMYNKSYDESIQAAIESSPFSRKVRVFNDKIRLDTSILKEFFTNTLEKVVSNIKDTLQNEEVTGTKTIVMAGGFSASPLVQDTVKQAFPDCNIIVSEEPAFTILEGAVLKGHDPEQPTKTCLVSEFTYGVHMCHINDERGCSEVEREETKIFIRKGETVYEGDKATWEFTLEACDMEHMEIQFFRSTGNEMISVNEKDIEYLKKVQINFDGLYTKSVHIDVILNRSHFVGTVTEPEQYVYIEDLNEC